MSKALGKVPALPAEIPALREAYAAETAAIARIDDIKRRRPLAAADVVLRRRDRAALAGRAARGEVITGADLRKAEEAILDAEATVTLLEESLPAAVTEAQAAARSRAEAEHAVPVPYHVHLRAIYEAAEEAFLDAQEARDRALANTRRLPPEMQAELDATLDSHGRDRAAPGRVAEFYRLQEVNRSRKQMGQPLMEIA